jgi:hypothetical protein
MNKIMSLPNGLYYTKISGVGVASLDQAAENFFGVAPQCEHRQDIPSGCVVLLRNPIDRYAALASALQLTDDELIAGILGNDLRYCVTLATYERHGVLPDMNLYRRESIDDAAAFLGIYPAPLIGFAYDSATLSGAAEESLRTILSFDISLWDSLVARGGLRQ